MTKTTLTGLALIAFLASAPAAMAQAAAPAEKPPAKAAKAPASDKDLNIKEYIDLLRKDVRAEKAKVMGAVMQLDAEDATKFWPLYKEYEAELSKVNDMRLANIQEYARTYTQMTDDKADELIRKAMDYQKQRSELLAKYYDRMKQELGAITAARFVQVEHQLLLLVDLQIASQLPVVGS